MRPADSERREISKNLRGKAGPDRRASLARWLAPTRTLSERAELAGSFPLQALYGPLAAAVSLQLRGISGLLPPSRAAKQSTLLLSRVYQPPAPSMLA